MPTTNMRPEFQHLVWYLRNQLDQKKDDTHDYGLPWLRKWRD